jgi:rubrerythrin
MSEQNQIADRADAGPLNRVAGRREFLKWSGVGAATVVAAACDVDRTRTIVETLPPDTIRVEPGRPPSATINFANDFGVLNFAFALEQLEAAFYTQVVATPYAGITDAERRVMIDLRDHEVVHRDFLRAAISASGGTPIGNLTPDFQNIDFTSRVAVLTAARNFEDLGVGAYNGAGQFLTNPALLKIAGKIISVEARHASAIRDLLNPRSRDFAPRAFDDALRPEEVAAAAAPFIRNRLVLTNVPNFVPSANRS